MATNPNRDHDQDMQEVASRMESSKLSRRPSRNSSSQTPKRHPARIEKPRSNHQSPRALERRRTLTAVRQYGTLDDHYRKMFGLEGEDEDEESEDGQEHHTTRPFSWHPSSAQWSGQNSSRSSMEWQGHGVEDASSNCGSASHHIQQNGNTISEHAEARISAAQYASHVDAAWSSYMHGQTPSNSTNPSQPSVSHSSTSWFLGSQAQYEEPAHRYLPHSQEGTFLPIQTNKIQEEEWDQSTRHRLVRQKSAELIGLGLYDPPGSTPPPMHPEGKGLKLEETWQPPEDMEDADADEESEDEEEEPPRPEDTKFAPATLPLVNMSGQSFLFEEDEGLKNEWWYHQLKNPAPVPQDGTLGLGWL